MTLKKMVWVSCRFVGYHRWLDAPEDSRFLREYHRHEFHVMLGVEVKGSNREVEFLALKEMVRDHLEACWEGRYFESSCEQIAESLLATFNACFVEVSEDGENGATVWDL